jgi:hypothetical protein
MIPRIKTGSSFKGAALYYLHDKRLPGEQVRLTSERVAWTYAINTLEDEPEAVIREMQHTALSQSYLKRMSGNRSDGRPTGKTVMTVALSWSPEQNPNQSEMIAAARSFLQYMGFQDHQALLLCHNDTRHPHIHVILNRVHPETGMTVRDNWSWRRCQEWALAYEREHGRIFCHAREAKYGRGEPVTSRHVHHGEWRNRRESSNDNAALLTPEQAEWATLKASQREERIAFWKGTAVARHDLRVAVRDEVREELRPQWQTYALHKIEKQEAARRFDQETRRAIRHYRREAMRLYDRPYDVQAVHNLKARQRAYHKQQREDLTAERAAINSRTKERAAELLSPLLDSLADQRRAQYEELLRRQREDKAELRDSQQEPARHKALDQAPNEWRKARTEVSEARHGRTDKQIEQEARRRERIERRLAERHIAIQRDRGGGGWER